MADRIRTNRKTEEKKMSMSKNIARLAVTAGLTAALSFGGVMAPVTMAFAAGTQNSITITQAENNGTTQFKAYQIFKADVADKDGSKVVSNVKWASAEAEKAVLSVLTADPATGISVNSTAQEVADYLATITGTNGYTRLEQDSTLNKIALAVEKGNVTASDPFKAGKAFTAESVGYYLFTTDTSSLKTNETQTGTSPIFAVVGGDPVTVTEKTSIPKVDKQILDDNKNKTADNAADSDWVYVGDSQIGQDIDYKLTGTVADNIASYAKYEYKFEDTLSKGLVVTKDTDGTTPKDLHVYIVDTKTNKKTEVKSDNFKATVTSVGDGQNSELLTVSFDDLKTVTDGDGNVIAVDKDSKVVVTYKAHLTEKASYEADGNTNTVKLVYSNNPMGGGTGTSTGKTVTDYVFGLDVTKIDSENQDKKLVAGFKVQVVDNGDNASANKWLSEDGSLVDENQAYEFTTDESTSKVFIPGLVAGTYQITETTTPAGYNTIAPIAITVTPKYDTNGKLEELTVSEDSSMVDSGTATGATIPLTVKNKKGSGLPLTGLNGVTFTWIAGGAVLCIGVAHLIRSRKQAEESEQE